MHLHWRVIHHLVRNSDPSTVQRSLETAQKTSHSLISVYSGRFTTIQLGCLALEKEVFVIITTLDNMHFFTATACALDFSTDNNNSIFLLEPFLLIADLSQSSTRKVLWWALQLISYTYTCFHANGFDNVWAYMLTSWSAPKIVRQLIKIPPLSTSQNESFWRPSVEEIAQMQKNHSRTQYENLKLCDGLWKTSSNAMRIPEEVEDLQVCLCIIVHTGWPTHRGEEPTMYVLHQNFEWQTLWKDVHAPVESRIHSLSTNTGEKVSHLLRAELHGITASNIYPILLYRKFSKQKPKQAHFPASWWPYWLQMITCNIRNTRRQ